MVREVMVRETGPFTLDAGKLSELGITPREHEVLALIAQGLSNREIGEKLYVSHRTVSTHLYRIYPKLRINARGQLGSALQATS